MNLSDLTLSTVPEETVPVPPPLPLELLAEARPCHGQNAHLFTTPDAFEDEPMSVRLGREGRARLLCAGCPVRTTCLGYALATQPTDGIWGGFTASEVAVLADSVQEEVA
jgi:WhiB family redox-sensing transcriptional regulator